MQNWLGQKGCQSGCAELNLWRVKVSVPLAIHVWIQTLSLKLSLSLPLSFPSPFPPFQHRKSQERRRVVPRPDHLLVQEHLLSLWRYSPRLAVSIARPVLYPRQVLYLFFSLSCLANLLQFFTHTDIANHACITSRSGSPTQSVSFLFFFLNFHWLHKISTSSPLPQLPNQPRRGISHSSSVDDANSLVQRTGRVGEQEDVPPRVTLQWRKRDDEPADDVTRAIALTWRGRSRWRDEHDDDTTTTTTTTTTSMTTTMMWPWPTRPRPPLWRRRRWWWHDANGLTTRQRQAGGSNVD